MTTSKARAQTTALCGLKELLSRVSFHIRESGRKDIYIKTSLDQDDDVGHEISLEDHVYRGRVNFPHNCFFLDLENKTNMRKKGIKVIWSFYQICDGDETKCVRSRHNKNL